MNQPISQDATQCVLCIRSQNPASRADLACLQLANAFKSIATFLWDFHFWGKRKKRKEKKTSSAAQVAVYRTWNKPPKVIISEDIRAGVSGCSGTDASQAVT